MSQADPPDSPNSVERLQNVSLVHYQRDLVKRLPGFNKKSHKVPDEVNSRTEAFVAKIASQQVKDDLESVFAALRSAFRFKRTEIESTDWDAGSGAIATPFFRYVSSVAQDETVAEDVVWKRDVSQITDLDQVLTENFTEAFGDVFDTVEFAPESPISLEEVVDRVESIEDERVWIEYDRHLTWCEVTLEDCDEKVRITQDSFRITHGQSQSPRVLVDSLFRIQNRLLGFADGEA